MSCRDFLPALRDHAAGAEATPPLAAHLRSCLACGAVFETERRLLSAIDGVLAGVGEAEPSPAFLARARALAERPPATHWPAPVLRTAAAFLVVGLSAAVLQRFEWNQAPAPAPSTLVAPASPPQAPSLPSLPSVEPRSAPKPRSVPVTAALVPPGQEALVQRFAALVDSGVVELPPQILESDPPGRPLQEPTELFVSPLTIQPIEAAEAPSEE